MVYSSANGTLIPYETPKKVRGRKCRTTSIIMLCIVMLGVNIFFLILLRQAIEDSNDVDKADMYMGFITAFAILITNSIYYHVAYWANEYENHRTDREFENALIWKSFAFRFINAYNALFYVSFLKS